MGTELGFNSRNITIDTETDGRPAGNHLYKQSATQLFYFGKRIMTTFGRVFYYGRAKTALLAGYGAANYFTASKHVAYAALPTAIAIGQDWADVTVGASNGYGSGGWAADELVGGTIVVGHNAATSEQRDIIRNNYMSNAGGTMRVWVDGAFETAQSISNGAEIYPNEFGYLGKGSLEYNAFMGVPAINVSSGYFAFMQTYGKCWIVPGGGDASPGDSANDRTAYFVGDGSVNFGTALTVETGYQYAGYCIDTTASGTSAMPLIMLDLRK